MNIFVLARSCKPGKNYTSEIDSVVEAIELHGRALQPAMIAAQRKTLSGWHDCRVILWFRTNWFCTRETDADWHLREVSWRIQLEGDAPLEVAMTNPVSKQVHAEIAPNKPPNRVVNAVPYVCAADPASGPHSTYRNSSLS